MFKELVVENLDVGIFAGTPFLELHDICVCSVESPAYLSRDIILNMVLVVSQSPSHHRVTTNSVV